MILAPLFSFLVLALLLSVLVRHKAQKRLKDKQRSLTAYLQDYFLGNHTLGSFVLVMTTIATYGSVSSFVGGPGQAWNIGFGWVYMAAVQVTALILLYGIFGKKLALIGRKTGAVTIPELLAKRFESKGLGICVAFVIVIFFLATMVAQFVGGAKLFEAATGYSYTTGLALFGFVSILFTAFGGFRGVALTDALCGIAMLVGILIFACGLFASIGNLDAAFAFLAEHKPQTLDVFSEGNMPLSLYISQWLLVGILTLCLPQSSIRCMSYDSTQSLHKALVIGTVIMGFMMISITALGVFCAVLMPETLETYGQSIDSIIPYALVHTLPSWLVGIAIMGPLAASISTVSSLLIAAASSLINDMLLSSRRMTKHFGEKKSSIAFVSQGSTLVLGLMVLVLALTPPDVIWKINMFAFGGLETAFAGTLLVGIFVRFVNKYGALASLILGVGSYCLALYFGFKIFDLHQITIGLTVALASLAIGSLVAHACGFRHSPQVDHAFFPHHKSS